MAGFPGRQTRSGRHRLFIKIWFICRLVVEQSKTRRARAHLSARACLTHAKQDWRGTLGMQDFMKDRYGVDDLSCALGALGVVLTLVGTIFNLRAVSIVALAILIVALLRSFSKNRDARYSENAAFRRMMAKLPFVGERFGGAGSGYRGSSSSRAVRVLPSSLSARLAPPK